MLATLESSATMGENVHKVGGSVIINENVWEKLFLIRLQITVFSVVHNDTMKGVPHQC